MAKKDTTKLLGLAAIAAGAFYLLRPKTAKAATSGGGGGGEDLPPPPENDATPPQDDPAPPGTPKRNAPPLSNQDKVQAISTGKFVVTEQTSQMNAALMGVQGWDTEMGPPPEGTPAEVAEVKAFFGVPSNRSPASWIADAAYYGTFPGTQYTIPRPKDRGNGWGGYIEVWNALYNDALAKLSLGLK